MRNRYAGTCYRCGLIVEPGQGHFERHQGGWRTQHASCCIAAREFKSAAGVTLVEMPDGGLKEVHTIGGEIVRICDA